MRLKPLRPLIAVLALAVRAAPAAAVPIEDFESGLGGVSTSGSVTLQTASFGIAPLDASTTQALLSTGTGATTVGNNESALGLPVGTIDAIFSADVDPFSTGSGATQGSALQITFVADAGDTLQWDWAFVTNEVSASPGNNPPAPGTYTDYAWYFLDFPTATDGGAALTHANDSGVTFVTSPTSFLDQVNYTTISLAIPETGTYSITLGVHDVQDTGFDSGLVIDAFRLVKGPEPGTGLLLLGGLLGLSAHARRRR